MPGQLLSNRFLDTTGHSDAQWAKLAPQLHEEFAGQWSLDPRDAQSARASLRHVSPTAIPIYALFRMPDRNWMPYTVRCRDLSEAGVGLYHGSYMHPDTRCYILFKRQGKSDKILGRVKHCALVSGKIHLMGVSFDSPIDLKTYLPLLNSATQRTDVSDSVVGMIHNEDAA